MLYAVLILLFCLEILLRYVLRYFIFILLLAGNLYCIFILFHCFLFYFVCLIKIWVENCFVLKSFYHLFIFCRIKNNLYQLNFLFVKPLSIIPDLCSWYLLFLVIRLAPWCTASTSALYRHLPSMVTMVHRF